MRADRNAPTDPLRALFSPRTVALVGASSDPNKLGGRPIRFLREFGWTGTLYPINPRAAEVQGHKAYASIRDVPGEVDQAVVVVPAQHVESALAECAAKGVKVAQILSSGFAEIGDEGRAAQARLVAIAQAAGMRITGPNTLGCVSPGDRYCATFATALNGLKPNPGGIAMVTQSGAFGSCAYVMASLRGLGLSRIISTGNEADVDVADCISFMAHDPQTTVICAALESCQRGDRLRTALATAARAKKPVIIIKIGRSGIGAEAAMTHTGTLAGADAVFDAIFEEGGAVRVTSIEEMVDAACLLSVGGRPDSPSTCVISVSGGIGILLADTAEDLDLELPPLPPETRARIIERVPFAAGSNPLDVTAQIAALPGSEGEVGKLAFEGGGYASMLFFLSNNALNPPVFEPRKRQLLDLKRAFPDRVLVAVMPSHPDVREELETAGIPVFEDPTRAARAVANGARFAALWAVLDDTGEPAPRCTADDPLPEAMNEAASKRVLAAAGLPFLPERTCTSADEAAAAAAELGFPVAMKILSRDIAHKSEAGGVALALDDARAVRAAFGRVTAAARTHAPGASVAGVLVAPMVHGGLETILGVHRDPVFGPMVMLGLGGIYVELFAQVAFASAPLTRARADALIAAQRWAPMLDGLRGKPPLDRAALADALVKLAAFAAAHRDTLEGVEMNPFLVREDGCISLDALIIPRR